MFFFSLCVQLGVEPNATLSALPAHLHAAVTLELAGDVLRAMRLFAPGHFRVGASAGGGGGGGGGGLGNRRMGINGSDSGNACFLSRARSAALVRAVAAELEFECFPDRAHVYRAGQVGNRYAALLILCSVCLAILCLVWYCNACVYLYLSCRRRPVPPRQACTSCAVAASSCCRPSAMHSSK